MTKLLKVGLSALALSVLASCGGSGSSEASKATGLSTAEESHATGLSTEAKSEESHAAGLSTEGKSSEVTPEESSEATPEESSEAIPEESSEATPEESSEATPEESSEATPEESSEEVVLYGAYLAGSFNSWNKADENYKMEYDEEEEVWGIDVNLKANAEFKVVYHLDGEESWYPAQIVKITESGFYYVEYNPMGDAVYFDRIGDYQGEETETTYYLVGNFNGWTTQDPAYLLEYDEDFEVYIIYGVTFAEGAEFKVVDSDGVWYPGGSGNNVVLPEGGVFDVYFDPTDAHADDEDWLEGGIYLEPSEVN